MSVAKSVLDPTAQLNDPCPCGSGLTHRWCCFPEMAVRAAGDAYGARVALESAVMKTVMLDSLQHTPFKQYEVAWQAFMFGQCRALEQVDLTAQSDLMPFLAWFLFRRHDAGDTPAIACLARSQGEMPVYDKIIREVIEQPFTFWMAGSFEPGQPIPVRDLLLGREYVLTEPAISSLSSPGDVFYARVVNINSIDGFFMQAPISLPMSVVPTIYSFCQTHLPRSLQDLHQLDDSTRGLWMRLCNEYDDEADHAGAIRSGLH